MTHDPEQPAAVGWRGDKDRLKTSVAAAFGLPPLYDPTQILGERPRLINSTLIDGQLSAPMAPLKFDPDIESETLSYILKGEPLQVLAETNGWQLVVSVIDGYLGWLDANIVSAEVQDPTHRVSAPLSHVYSAPNLKSKPLSTLVMGSYVNVTGSSQHHFMPLTKGGWAFEGHLDVVGTYQNDPVTVAESLIGAPYLWGGRTALGIDCSGLVQMALAACGHRVHRDSGPQYQSLGRVLEDSEKPQRGDLAFFPGHVGWMLDSVHLLHANASKMAVTVNTVDTVTGWIAAETRNPPFLGYKRL
jgi:cell wall-associated NlpC family hydrolase